MGNTIRFSGLASGLDTESIVTAMLTPYQSKITAAQQQQTLLEWKKEAYKEMNTKVYNFYSKTVFNGRFESAFNKKSITSSNEGKVKIESGGTASEGTHTISEITQLASSARIQTSAIKDINGEKAKIDTKLSDLGIADGEELMVTDSASGTAKKITLTGDMTISQLESTLKKEMSNASVSFDKEAGAFFVASKKTGADQSIQIEGSDASVLSKLGLGDGAVHTGKNAKFKYNGVEMETQSNSISVNGVNATLIAETTGNEEISISSKVDTEAVYDFIKEFVEEYNSLIEDINKKLYADSTRGYDPLTDEQKKEMSETDIKAWEDKIKGGLLRRDDKLSALTSSMREVLSGSVEGGSFTLLSDIGIATKGWNERGKLHIDETKLRKAINEDLDGVMNLFAGSNGSEGLLDKLYKSLDDNYKTISGVKTATSMFNDTLLDKNITSQKQQVSKWQERFDNMETMYYAKFTAMEKMLSQLNSQSSFFMQQ